MVGMVSEIQTGIERDRSQSNIVTVSVVQFFGTTFSLDFDIQESFYQTTKMVIVQKCINVSGNRYTCSSSCIVPTSGSPSTTRAIIVIKAMLAKLLGHTHTCYTI